MTTSINTNKKKGFSIIEILIVLGIITIIVAIIVSTFSLFGRAQALEKDTETVIESLEQARSQTLSSLDASQYGVHFGTNKVTIFTGTTYSSSASSNVDMALSSSDTILTVTISGGGNDIVFNRLTGETVQNGTSTIIISSPTSSRTKTVTIYKTGLIQ